MTSAMRGRGVRQVLTLGLVAVMAVALVACDDLQQYMQQQPQQPRPPVAYPPPQPPVIVQPPQQPVVVQPPVIQPLPDQPIVPPPPDQGEGGPVWVDTLDFDPSQVAVQLIGGRWFLMAGDVPLACFEGDEAGARRGLAVIRFYRMNQQCSLGRPTPLLQYYLVSGQPPMGPMPGEAALALDHARLNVAQVDGRWMLVQGNMWVLDFGLGEMEARAALAIIRSSGFTHLCFVGQPQPVMVYFRAGGAAGGILPYVQARLTADPRCYSGPLPASIGFRGSISVGQPCDVTYVFVGPAGPVGPPRAIRFPQAGFAHVNTDLPVAQEGSGWLTLRILSPVVTQSRPALFEVRPPAMPLVQASVIAQPPVHVGRLPATIRFRGWLAVGQPCDVQFAFVRSDGATGPVQTLRFLQRGSQEVLDGWTLHRDYVGWAAIRVVSPVDFVSEQAPFEVRSGGHRRIQVSLAANPSVYSGPLPAPIDFRGMIAVSAPCEVQYLFVRSDGGQSPVQRLRFDRPGAREVNTRWAVRSEGPGWQVLRVLAPVQVESEQAAFEVRQGQPPLAVSATLTADPPRYVGPSPANVLLRAVIRVSRPCDVRYSFLRSDAPPTPPELLRFPQAGAREVTLPCRFLQDFKGWAAIRVTAPNAVESDRAAIEVNIKSKLRLRATLEAEPRQHPGPLPATIRFRGSVSADEPCDVQYAFVRSDGTRSAPRMLRFDRPGVQQVEESRQFPAETKGWEKLVILGPNDAESDKADFEVELAKAPKIDADLRAVPPKYNGAGPATIRFQGTIKVSRACGVRYSFVRSDGTASAPQVLRFGGPGVQQVEESRQFAADAKGWEMIRIFAPVATESNKADFDVNIREAPAVQVKADLKADPRKYKGPAPGAIHFKGTLRVNQPCDVRYTFVRSDGAPVPVKTLRFDRAGAQDVELALRLPNEGAGWVMLRVVAPVAVESDREAYDVEFDRPKEKEKPKEKEQDQAVNVSATLEADPAQHAGKLPVNIKFKGTIRVSGPCQVTYVFVRSDGSVSNERTLKFNKADDKQVNDTWKVEQNLAGWAVLRILAPVKVDSAQAAFQVRRAGR